MVEFMEQGTIITSEVYCEALKTKQKTIASILVDYYVEK
jgi:hypothetical protein